MHTYSPRRGTPAAAGYRMPAEWEAHEAVWLSWPRAEGISFPGAYEEIIPVLVDIVDALRGSENVRINVQDGADETKVRKALSGIDHEHVEFYRIPTNEPWTRDHGPMFIRREADPRLAIVDWAFNAWGGKYPPFELDDAVPTRIADALSVPCFYPGLVMEGGSIDLNGTGTLLTTTSCLLNPNRNRGKSQERIEQALADHLGATHFLWLGEGIEGDDTDGHIDDITRFVSRTTVVTVIENAVNDSNHLPLQKNLELLHQMKIEDGTPLTVISLPMPPAVVRNGQRLPASYANFYIGNTVVLVPTFDALTDEEAIDVLSDCFPERRMVPIDARSLVWGLGAFHCLTQQQPAV
jgi:agmatine deiminase